MSATVTSAFAPNSGDVRAMNRMLVLSVALHVAIVVAIIYVPREWFEKKPTPVMTISLGGTTGPKTTGMTNIGGQAVEEPAPPPKRPEPVRPTPPKVDTPAPVKMAAPDPVKPAKPANKTITEPVAPRPVTSAAEVRPGSTRVDTGVRGQSFGLTDGGGTGGLTDLRNFCCPEYLTFMRDQIFAVWRQVRDQSGTNVVRFTVLRNGTITNIEMEQPSGIGILDRNSQSALQDAALKALPPEYKGDTLTVHITFPYGVQ